MTSGLNVAEDRSVMTLGEHLEELRKRVLLSMGGLLVAMAAAALMGRRLVALLMLPLSYSGAGDAVELASGRLDAGISAYMRVVFYSGVLLASPWIFWQIWLFVSAGLRDNEKRILRLAAPLSAGLFVAGAMFFLFAAAAPAVAFLIGVNNWLGWRSIIIAHDYIAFVTSMMIIFGLAFQTPIAVLLLAKTGLVKAESFAAHRRCVMFSIAAVCAIATPSASPIDMLVLALPVWLLYELGVLLARQFATRRD